MKNRELPQKGLERRRLLAGAGIASAAVATGACSYDASVKLEDIKWDHEVDVVCVGSGAAACSAAIAAVDAGAKVMLVEKMPILGGTTGKSGGVTWIFNNPILQKEGLADPKADALRYAARYGYPLRYNPADAKLGLDDNTYGLLEAFYDEGSRTIDRLGELGAVKFKEFRMFQLDNDAPDYADHLPENKRPTRRALEPAAGSGSAQGGGSLAAQMEAWLRKQETPILTDTRITKILKADDRVVGLAAEHSGNSIYIKARKGVVFGSGGYAHNVELVNLHQPSIYGACAMPGSTGDFIPMAQEIGAKMGDLSLAWRTQVVLGEALENRVLGGGAFVLPGDSMILVNKYGDRCVNEKRDYNDRTKAHFHYNPTHEEFTNHLMFMLFDERSIDAFGGAYPFPMNKGESPFLISGNSWEDVFAGISRQLAQWKGKTGGVALQQGFAEKAMASIGRFNEYAIAGEDPEFLRGKHMYDREWHLLFSARRAGTQQPENPYPNNTMHPIADSGPYYALILAPGALDTAGGPVINKDAQVLAASDEPIKGLYAAGNCVSAPTGNAYLGAGGTIGPAVTFGHIAGRNAAKG